MSVKLPLLLLLIITSFLQISNAQCIVDAGENQNICYTDSSELYLNGEIISGNITQIKWEAYYSIPAIGYEAWASDMLSDTTILNPEILSPFGKSVNYYLTAIDELGNSCSDTVNFKFSMWIFTPLDKIAFKAPDDTISLWTTAFSNFPHIEYEWSPDYRISDIHAEFPKVWNDTTIFYDIKITDSIGCVVYDDPFDVYVLSTNTKEQVTSDNIELFPNPASNEVRIKGFESISHIILSDNFGHQLSKFQSREIIELGELPSGIYFLTFIDKSGNIKTKQLIVQ